MQLIEIKKTVAEALAQFALAHTTIEIEIELNEEDYRDEISPGRKTS